MTLKRDDAGRPTGLDWDALRPPAPPDSAAAPTPRPAPKRPTTPARTPRKSVSKPHAGRQYQLKVPAEKIAEVYNSGLSIRATARELGLDQSTVARRVRLLGISRTEQRGKGGPAKKTHCLRRHEFTSENTRELPGGGRSCKTCERIRGRETKARQREREKTDGAVP